MYSYVSHGNIFPFAHMLNLDLFKLFLILPDYVVRRNPRMDAATRVLWSLLKN